MYRFCGYGLELFVDEVLARHRGTPTVSCATDATGQHWLIVALESDLSHLSWVCAPVSSHATDLVRTGHTPAAEAVAHCPSGWVELVSVVDGHSVPDRRVACADLPAGFTAPIRLAS